MRALARFCGPTRLLALAVLGPALPAAAQQAPLIPLEQFFDSPAIIGAQISPDGRWLAYLKPYRGKLNLHVRPIQGDAERRVTADTVRAIRVYYWSADGSRLLYLQDRGGNENFHIFSSEVNGDSTDAPRDLTPFEGVRADVMDLPRELPRRALIAMNRRDPSLFDAYWLDLESGALSLAAENPGRFAGYLADRKHGVVVAQAQGPAGETEIHVRPDTASPWRRVASYPSSENVQPLRLMPDGRHLYLISDHGRTEFARLVVLDLANGKDRVLHEDPMRGADLQDVLFGAGTDSVLWTAYNADTVRIYPRAASIGLDLERIRRLHDGTPSADLDDA